MYLMIDNYDSFVYNLRAYFEEARHEILVVENDGITTGKLSPLTHSGEGLFRGLPQDFLVTRYHSLVIDEATLPQEYQVDARTEDQAVMAISHRTYPIYGVQFHPEAVLTQYGHELLENFHCICQQWQQERTEVCYA